MDINVTPLVTATFQDNRFTAGAGVALGISIVSVNSSVITGTDGNLDLRSGFSLMKGTAGIYYNYTFNLASGNTLLPFSLKHQAGLSISLNNVDKRKTIKTIKFPNL